MRFMKHGAGIASLLALITAIPTAQAQFQKGDVFAAVNAGRVWRYSNAGAFQQALNTTVGGFTTGMAFDAAGNLYVTDFSANTVSKFDNFGNLVSASYTSGGALSAPESIVFDKVGNFYVSSAGANRISLYNAAGAFQKSWTVAIEDRGVDWMDLDPNGVMYYTSEGQRIFRYDLNTSTQLPNFTAGLNANEAAYALRLLPSGGVLVADTSDIKRLDAAGNIIQTYDTAGQNSWFALNLDPDGKSFWSGDFGTDQFFKFDIASGALLTSVNTGLGGGNLFGLAVNGELTIIHPTTPDAGPGLLLSALTMLGLVGARWRKA